MCVDCFGQKGDNAKAETKHDWGLSKEFHLSQDQFYEFFISFFGFAQR